jgi:hypothetical protein
MVDIPCESTDNSRPAIGSHSTGSSQLALEIQLNIWKLAFNQQGPRIVEVRTKEA